MEGDEVYYVDQQLGFQPAENLEPHEISMRFREFL